MKSVTVYVYRSVRACMMVSKYQSAWSDLSALGKPLRPVHFNSKLVLRAFPGRPNPGNACCRVSLTPVLVGRSPLDRAGRPRPAAGRGGSGLRARKVRPFSTRLLLF